MFKHKTTMALALGWIGLMGMFAFIVFDEPLSEDTRYLLSLVDQPSETDAYYLLMGLGASEDLDPIEAGKACVHQGADFCVAGQWGRDYDLGDCSLYELACLANLDVSKFSKQYAVPISRFKRFISEKEYNAAVAPSAMDFLMVDYDLLNISATLVIAGLYQAQDSDGLERLLEQLRRHLVLTDSLLTKFYLLIRVKNTVEALAELEESRYIQPLTDSELSVARAYAYEFAGNYNCLPYVSDKFDEGGFKTRFGKTFVFKQRVTANMFAANYRLLAEETFAEDRKTVQEINAMFRRVPIYQYVRNLSGVLLVQAGLPQPLFAIEEVAEDIEQGIQRLNQSSF